MDIIGLIAGVSLLAFVFYGLIWLVVCVIDRIVNGITDEVTKEYWEEEDDKR